MPSSVMPLADSASEVLVGSGAFVDTDALPRCIDEASRPHARARLDLFFDLIVELATVAIEDVMPLSSYGLWEALDHHAELHSNLSRDKRNAMPGRGSTGR